VKQQNTKSIINISAYAPDVRYNGDSRVFRSVRNHMLPVDHVGRSGEPNLHSGGGKSVSVHALKAYRGRGRSSIKLLSFLSSVVVSLTS